MNTWRKRDMTNTCNTRTSCAYASVAPHISDCAEPPLMPHMLICVRGVVTCCSTLSVASAVSMDSGTICVVPLMDAVLMSVLVAAVGVDVDVDVHVDVHVDVDVDVAVAVDVDVLVGVLACATICCWRRVTRATHASCDMHHIMHMSMISTHALVVDCCWMARLCIHSPCMSCCCCSAHDVS